MQVLLPLLFVVSVLTPMEEPLTRFELVNTVWDPSYEEPLTRFQIVNMWDSHPEGWDKVYAVPIGDPFEFAEATLEEGVATRMGNGTSDVERWRELVASQFPAEQVENALCAIRSESGGEPHIRNLEGSNARGLFQIMTTVWADDFGWTHEDFYDPSLNIYAAARIWEGDRADGGSGWRPWSPRTRRNCGL